MAAIIGNEDELFKKKESNKSKINFWSKSIGGAFLIAGTCIGAGMLGLPVQTAAAGFYPTLFGFIITWAILLISALALLEVALLFPGEVNYITLAQKTLGPLGKYIAWVVNVLFLYSVLAAYAVGGTTMLAFSFKIDLSSFISLSLATIVFVLPFAFMVYRGAKTVDYVNRFLILGLVLGFFLMSVLYTRATKIQMLEVGNPKYLLFTFPLLVTSFGYHGLLPTLKSYLKENIKQLRIAVIIGSIIPFIFYLAWEYLVLNTVPVFGESGLVSMINGGGNPGELLLASFKNNSSAVALGVGLFSIFALTSSFVGVALGLSDFFADGLKIKKTRTGKLNLLLITFLPPVLFVLIYPKGFLYALGYAGIFASILLILLPVLMAWSARYNKKISKSGKSILGKISLLIPFVFAILIICIEILKQLDILPIPTP